MQLNSGPLITYYSADKLVDRPSEQTASALSRVELSRTTVDNWMAKTSNLLADEFGFGPELAGESSALVDLPLHWLHSVWLSSLWNVGAHVTTKASAAKIIVTEADNVDSALSRAGRHQAVVGCTLGTGLDPLGASSTESPGTVPPTAIDYSHDVRMFADNFDSGFTHEPNDIVFTTTSESFTRAQLDQLAAEFLTIHEINPGGRVLLSELPLEPKASWPTPLVEHPSLVAALVLGALLVRPSSQAPASSLVLCRGLSAEQLDHVASQERATRVS